MEYRPLRQPGGMQPWQPDLRFNVPRPNYNAQPPTAQPVSVATNNTRRESSPGLPFIPPQAQAPGLPYQHRGLAGTASPQAAPDLPYQSRGLAGTVAMPNKTITQSGIDMSGVIMPKTSHDLYIKLGGKAQQPGPQNVIDSIKLPGYGTPAGGSTFTPGSSFGTGFPAGVAPLPTTHGPTPSIGPGAQPGQPGFKAELASSDPNATGPIHKYVNPHGQTSYSNVLADPEYDKGKILGADGPSRLPPQSAAVPTGAYTGPLLGDGSRPMPGYDAYEPPAGSLRRDLSGFTNAPNIVASTSGIQDGHLMQHGEVRTDYSGMAERPIRQIPYDLRN